MSKAVEISPLFFKLTFMKNHHLFLVAILSILISACGSNGTKKSEEKTRVVCLSKQYNEIIYALDAEKDLVAVDLSSVYPKEINKLTKVGYHRALSAEGILAVKPTLIIHDNNIGPDHVVAQLNKLKIPMLAFNSESKDLKSTCALISEMGKYFHKEKEAKKINEKLTKELNEAIASGKKHKEKPSVLIIHYGQARNHYLIVTNKSTAAKMVNWAGGKLAVNGDRGMKQLSAEAIAASDPDVILMTDFGYDRLGSLDKIKELPGVGATKAAKNNKIYRVNEYDLIYLGPRTGKNTLAIEKLIHQ